MKSFVLLTLLLCTLLWMPAYKFKPCPCNEHKNELAPESTARRHLQEIARGIRQRWAGNNSPEAQSSAEPEDVVQAAHVIDQAASDESEEDEVFATQRNFTNEITELVAQNLLCVTGAEAVLKIVHSNYQKHLQEGHDIPKSWYLCKKIAMDGKEPVYFTRDFCPQCDYLYGVKSQRTYCPVCPGKEKRFDVKGNLIVYQWYVIKFVGVCNVVHRCTL
jgi:rubrerythrin